MTVEHRVSAVYLVLFTVLAGVQVVETVSGLIGAYKVSGLIWADPGVGRTHRGAGTLSRCATRARAVGVTVTATPYRQSPHTTVAP